MRALFGSLSEKRDVLLLSLVAFLPISRAFLFVRNRLNRDTGAYAVVDLQNSINIVAAALMLWFLLRPRARLSNELMLRGPTQWMIVYFGLCLLSLIWGGNPLYVTYQSLELIIVLFFMGHILGLIADPHDAIIYLCRFSAVTAFLPYVSGVLRSGGAIFQHTNSFSTCGAFGAILILACMKTGVLALSEVKYSLIGCLVPFIFGTSGASNIAFIVGLVLLWSLSREPRRTVRRMVVAMAVVCCVAVVAFQMLMPYLFPGKPLEQILSLHGRIGLWREFLVIGRQQMVLGGGFVVGERSVDLWGGGGFGSAHNALMSVFINTGIVGLILFVGAWFAMLRRTYLCHLWGDPYAYPLLAAMIVGLVNGMSYPLVGSSWRYVTTPFFGIVAYVSIFLNPAYYACKDESLLADDLCSS